jgi:diguanylate cyclase (GGDEF)-like protein
MSFRARLTLFFVLIVIVPMVSVAFVLFRLISDNETGKADAGAGAAAQTAANLYDDDRREADVVVTAVGADDQLARALRDGDTALARVRVRALLRQRGVARLVLTGGSVTLDEGAPDAIAPTRRDLIGAASERFGQLELSIERAGDFARRIKRLVGGDVVVTQAGRTLGSTLAGVQPAALPAPRERRDIEIGGREYRASSFSEDGFGAAPVRVTLLTADASRRGAIARSRLLAGGILLGFLVLALTFAVAVSRSLQAQIGSFLAAARRIASGDFSTEVTTAGRDEFAELGAEFNKMSHQLEARLEELRQERARLETSLRRIGQTFASNLDRDRLLEIVVRTAIDGVGADGGRASARPEPDAELAEAARAGTLDGALDAMRRAEAAALVSREGSEAADGDMHALAQPLVGEAEEVVGVVSVLRRGEPFDDRDRELLGYLAGTASVSIQNVDLHEAVQRQAVTDELTGLFNHRRFQEAMVSEAERAKRFGQPMGLVMIDIDNFKQVNDRFGHQTGDRVLAEVARVLRESSREIDAPARYGGEELAVVLPQTDLEGAYQLAERIRKGIASLDLDLGDDRGALTVTASLGVASLPQSALEPRRLLAAADAALYEAKRTGKNKTVRADGRV